MRKHTVWVCRACGSLCHPRGVCVCVCVCVCVSAGGLLLLVFAVLGRFMCYYKKPSADYLLCFMHKRSVWSSWKKTAQLGSESEKVNPQRTSPGSDWRRQILMETCVISSGQRVWDTDRDCVEVGANSSDTSGPWSPTQTCYMKLSGMICHLKHQYQPIKYHRISLFFCSINSPQPEVYYRIVTTEKLEEDGCDNQSAWIH